MDLNVVHAPSEWGIGGTEKAAELFVRNHDAMDAYPVGLKSRGQRAETLSDDGYDVYVPEDVEDFADFLKRNDIHILHTHDGNGELVTEAAKRAGTPLVIKSSQFGEYDQPDTGREIDHFIYPSNHTLFRTLVLNQLLKADDWPQNMTGIYNPLDTSELSSGTPLDCVNHLEERTPVIGKIGRPVPEKWGKLTIRAFAEVQKVRPDTKLLLVGAPEKIKKEARSLGCDDKVIYRDTLPPDKVNDFYASIDALAHTSAIGESFGYVIAEAMASGVPVVVDSTPMRDNAQIELVRHGGTDYIANSASGFSEALIRLLGTSSDTYSTKARERAEEFSADCMTRRLEGVYRRLAADHGLIEESADPVVSEASERDRIREYRSRYDHCLETSIRPDDGYHGLERYAWKIVAGLPAGREISFGLLRKFFIFSNEYI